MSTSLWSRRDWLKSAGIALGSLVIPIGCGKSPRQSTDDGSASLNPSAWLSVDRNGDVKLIVVKSEMGQGVRTTLAMIVADELGANWNQVTVRQADTLARFGEFSTGGSSSLEDSWGPLRRTAAAARAMLTEAAAAKWRVPAEECAAELGRVIHRKSQRELIFGDLVADAALLSVPDSPALKRPEDFHLIGQRIARIDSADMVSGRAVYGIDIVVPGMRYAMIARCPYPDGGIKSFDDTAARRVPGVYGVTVVPHQAAGHAARVRPGIAVIAQNTYCALKARKLLTIEWRPPPRPMLNTEQVYQALKSAPRAQARTVILRKSGEGGDMRPSQERTYSADYVIPYAAHASMEPLNCTAAVKGRHCEIWAGTQTPTNTQRLVAHALGTSADRVVIHNQLLGGGFGRRLNADFIVECALVSKAINAPVKVVWSREDDMQNDFYRAANYQTFSARVNAQNQIVAWQHLLAGPSTVRQIDGASATNPERQEILGLDLLPYEIPDYRVDYLESDPARIPIGWWRGIANTQNLLAVECFISDMAAWLGVDPVEFRLQHIRDQRLRHVIETARDRFRWNMKPPAGCAYGFAVCNYHGRTRVALALEACTNGGSAVPSVKRVFCAVDCGLVVNPSVVESQVEGSIVWGLSAALTGEVTIEEGRISIANFNDYPVLRLAETPDIEVELVASREKPSGIGEPVVPVVAPALAAAVGQLVGKRIDRQPVRL